MTNGDLLARLLPLVLQCYNVSDSVANLLQNARRERTQKLMVKSLKQFFQRKAIIIS